MNNDEQKFDQHIHSIRFDDQPSAAHRDKLEKQLLDAWDNRGEPKDDGYAEPTSFYLRKLAVAAGFLIVTGVLYWSIDAVFIQRDPFAHHPDKQQIHKILEEENVTGTEKKQLIAQIHNVWALVSNQDSEGLVAVLTSQDTAYAVRRWAATYLGKFGNQKTLAMLETATRTMDITDPEDPLMIAADKIRQRLNLLPQKKTPATKTPGVQSFESSETK